MSEAKQQASDVVSCLELAVDVTDQILRGCEPWSSVAGAILAQLLVDAQEVARGAPQPSMKIETVGAFHFAEPVSEEGEWLGDRIEAYERLAGAYQRLAEEMRRRQEEGL